MRHTRSLFTALLAVAVLFLLSGCGDSGGEAQISSVREGVSIRVVSSPEVHGWMDMALSQAPPIMAAAGDNTAWLLFEGGNLLRYSMESGRWKSYTIEGLTEPVDLKLAGETPVILTSREVLLLSEEDAEAVQEALPEGFTPLELGISGDELAVLGSRGGLAVMEPEGFTVYESGENPPPAGGLCRVGPDWVFMLEGGGLALFDPSIALWMFEDSPEGDILVSSQNLLFMGLGDTVLVRSSHEVWDHHARGALYRGGLLLSEEGISAVISPGETIAESPSFTPNDIHAMRSFRMPLWAVDDLGMTVYSGIGMVETSLPYYDTQRVSCSMAGQGSGGMQGSPGSVTEMMHAGAGTFRIYESVSIRPDPFTEFSMERRDARRNLEDISVEEFRLVGITLDPVGGNQAMVEDGMRVPYVLYEGTVLAKNSHVAEITSSEVIVIQEVIVDYTARGGGETTIPTIYSLRLHEEGGL